MRVFLQPSPETVNEEIKEEEFCRNLEEELPTSEPNGGFTPVCDLNLEGTVSHDVVDGYSEALNSEDMQVILKTMFSSMLMILFPDRTM